MKVNRVMIYQASSNWAAKLAINRSGTGVRLEWLNVARLMLSKSKPMRPWSILIPFLAGSIMPMFAATPEVAPTPTVPAAAAEQGKDVVHALNNAFAKVFETVAPSVVVIEISKKNEGNEGPTLDDFFFQVPPDENSPRRGQRNLEPIQSEGSGFIVRADGYIFTNFHVVEGADKIDVKLKDGRDFPAKVVGTDERTDVAVIKIEAKDLPVAQLGDSDALRVGEFAFAIGAPFKLDYTFTYGVISGKGRSKLFASNGSISDYSQTDASMKPCNSGGPLCNIDGKVIGMNTLIHGLNRGLGFAIPINMAKEVGSELIAGHKIVRPWIGVRIETLGDNASIRDFLKGVEKGVVVMSIEADAPASKTTLRPGDVITDVDGTPVATDSQLQHEILKKRVGQKVELNVWRRGQTFKIPITTGELPNEIARTSNESAPQPNGPREEELGKFGLQVQDLSKEVAERLHLGVQQGVIITDVTENSIAADQGLEREDVITEVDGKPVTDVKSFRDALNKADPKRGVLLYIDRKGSKTFAVLKAAGPETPHEP
jgi:serine protease Do